MEPVLEAADLWLRELEDRFTTEIVNHELGCTGYKYQYASATEARLAMLRAAYNRGVQDAHGPRDFDTDVQRVNELNRRNGLPNA